MAILTDKPQSRELLCIKLHISDRKLRKAVEDLLASRQAMYARADFTVDTSNLSPMQVTEEIVGFLRVGGMIRA